MFSGHVGIFSPKQDPRNFRKDRIFLLEIRNFLAPLSSLTRSSQKWSIIYNWESLILIRILFSYAISCILCRKSLRLAVIFDSHGFLLIRLKNRYLRVFFLFGIYVADSKNGIKWVGVPSFAPDFLRYLL